MFDKGKVLIGVVVDFEAVEEGVRFEDTPQVRKAITEAVRSAIEGALLHMQSVGFRHEMEDELSLNIGSVEPVRRSFLFGS